MPASMATIVASGWLKEKESDAIPTQAVGNYQHVMTKNHDKFDAILDAVL